MTNFFNILKTLNAKHWTILLAVGFIGVFGTRAIGQRIEDKAIESWTRQAELDVAAATIAAQSWLAQSETIISGLALGFKNSGRISTDEFNTMVVQAEEWNSEFSLDAVAVVERVTRDRRQPMERDLGQLFYDASQPGKPAPDAFDHMVVLESSDTDGLMRRYVDLLTFAEMGDVVKTAWRLPDKAIMGPSFADGNRLYTLVAIGVPNEHRTTVVVGRVDLSEMISVLMANHVPNGIVLRLTERDNEARAETLERPVIGPLKPGDDVLHTVTIRVTRGQARWNYNWDITDEYLGGAPTANATMVQIGGLIITILVVYSIGALSVQNAIIRRTVTERTQKLMQEVTERREAEEALRRSQKMEAVGQLTGGIAHDFNNLLGVIMGNLQIVQLEIEEDKTLTKNNALGPWVDTALRNVDRGVKLTQSLLKFSRIEAVEAKALSINDLVDEIDDLLRKSLTQRIDVRIDLARDLWLTKIDPSDFADTLTNLALNAGDAMPDGGSLDIRTSNQTLGAEHPFMNEDASAGEYVCLEIRDTGTGIDPDIIDKVFEPFFTTKESGRGTGLGLSMVFGFVRRSAGDIGIESAAGSGTVIRVYLPRADDDGVAFAQGVADPSRNLGGSETILIVDDEENMLDVAVELLRGLGYRTLTALDGPNALELLAARDDVDLLFSDVVMPGGMDGLDLASAAWDRDPDLRILITSGYTGGAHLRKNHPGNHQDRMERLVANLLAKPYKREELAIGIRRVLDGEA